jgi:hypothetical protein
MRKKRPDAESWAGIQITRVDRVATANAGLGLTHIAGTAVDAVGSAVGVGVGVRRPATADPGRCLQWVAGALIDDAVCDVGLAVRAPAVELATRCATAGCAAACIGIARDTTATIASGATTCAAAVSRSAAAARALSPRTAAAPVLSTRAAGARVATAAAWARVATADAAATVCISAAGAGAISAERIAVSRIAVSIATDADVGSFVRFEERRVVDIATGQHQNECCAPHPRPRPYMMVLSTRDLPSLDKLGPPHHVDRSILTPSLA